MLAGSHNLSGAAWGKVEEVKAEGREGETELVVMSFEISVLLARSLVITPPLPSYHPRSS